MCPDHTISPKRYGGAISKLSEKSSASTGTIIVSNDIPSMGISEPTDVPMNFPKKYLFFMGDETQNDTYCIEIPYGCSIHEGSNHQKEYDGE